MRIEKTSIEIEVPAGWELQEGIGHELAGSGIRIAVISPDCAPEAGILIHQHRPPRTETAESYFRRKAWELFTWRLALDADPGEGTSRYAGRHSLSGVRWTRTAPPGPYHFTGYAFHGYATSSFVFTWHPVVPDGETEAALESVLGSLQLERPRLETLRRGVRASFGFPLSWLDLPEDELEPVGADVDVATLWRTASWTPVRLAPPMRPDDPEFPTGRLIGHWGYGINSYALYYGRSEERIRTMLRLPYGGIYGDHSQQARAIRHFLPAWVAFENEVARSGSSIIAMVDISKGHCAVEDSGGQPLDRASVPWMPELDPFVEFVSDWASLPAPIRWRRSPGTGV